jgi:mRNA-degrading endonuclease toxin of MazEF toxin-antitoxin module
VSGAVLADQLTSLDRHARRIEKAGSAPVEVLSEIDRRLRPLLSLSST